MHNALSRTAIDAPEEWEWMGYIVLVLTARERSVPRPHESRQFDDFCERETLFCNFEEKHSTILKVLETH